MTDPLLPVCSVCSVYIAPLDVMVADGDGVAHADCVTARAARRALRLSRAAMALSILALLLCVLPAIAAADVTNVRPARSPLLEQLRQLADRFLADRDVIAPRGAIFVFDSTDPGLRGFVMRYPNGAWSPDININADDVAYVTAHPSDKLSGQGLCEDVVHEDAHTAGLEHTRTGFMTAYADGSADETVWPCRVWARDRARAAIARRASRRFNAPRPQAAP